MAHPEELTLSEDIKTEKRTGNSSYDQNLASSRTTNAVSDSVSPITLTLEFIVLQ